MSSIKRADTNGKKYLCFTVNPNLSASKHRNPIYTETSNCHQGTLSFIARTFLSSTVDINKFHPASSVRFLFSPGKH